MSQNLKVDFEKLSEKKKLIQIEEGLMLKNALTSDNADAILKAQNHLQAIQKREKTESKAILIDPLDMSASFGYKNKSFSMSYDVLRMMAKTHIIHAIISTRKDQVSAFCQPQDSKYGTGFVIQKKDNNKYDKKDVKLTKTDFQKMQSITDFLLSCGSKSNFWHADSFDEFVKKLVDDSLTLDQGTFEIIRNRRGEIVEFFATDGATFRVADSYDDDNYKYNEKIIKGYAPSYVQLIDGVIQAEFYPWELGFCRRNSSTNIRNNGYGKSELEDMIETVTAILNSDKYNSNFFKVGSAPKGILRYSGMINENSIQDFKREWMAQITGVANAHKMPIINADKMDFIPFNGNNRDMEFSKFQEFLIKISCAIYKIDPSEIGFPMSGSVNSSPMFEGGNEARLKYSKDKGLKPLLKQIERWINKYLVSQIDEAYEFKFVGIDGESSYNEELDQDIKALSNFMTLNEIRERRGLPPLEKGGDLIFNQIYYQSQMSQQQGGDDNQFGDQNGQGNEEENPFADNEEESNPFIQEMNKDFNTM